MTIPNLFSYLATSVTQIMPPSVVSKEIRLFVTTVQRHCQIREELQCTTGCIFSFPCSFFRECLPKYFCATPPPPLPASNPFAEILFSTLLPPWSAHIFLIDSDFQQSYVFVTVEGCGILQYIFFVYIILQNILCSPVPIRVKKYQVEIMCLFVL